MTNIHGLATLAAAILVLSACGDTPDPAPPPVEAAGPGEWIALFDGSNMDAFRGYGADAMPAGWRIEDDVLFNAEPDQGGDLVTREQFQDFELEFDWKLDAGGNSGVMFRVAEDRDYPYITGPEYQLLDNAGFPDGKPVNLAGANYDVHGVDRSAVRAAGEWNSARLVVDGPHVEHWLNGAKVVEYELFSPDWTARVAASKWADNPDYGARATGHIAIQGDHDRVWLRSVRIRHL